MIACEDTNAPRIYFRALKLREPSRIQFSVLSTEDGLSAPQHLVERLRDFKREFELDETDQLWVLLDEDHHFRGRHTRGTTQAISSAHQLQARIAVSNPCFEVWLLLHFEVPAAAFESAEDVLRDLKKHLSYTKSSFDVTQFDRGRVAEAVERARSADDPADRLRPPNPGSRVYLLLEEVLSYLDS